jgi:LysR family transcriptional regulator, glycine cleavage system transcriptional activator
MKRNTPTIQQLLAFEAMARHLALPAAADELCVTASAVSRSVAELETFIGRPLFDRAGKRFRLLPDGADYLARVAPALQSLETASLEMRTRGSGDGMLVLASVPTFTTKWLVPRLPSLRQQYPGITLNFHRHLAGNDAHPPEVDAAIRYGTGEWPGVVAEYVAGHEFALVVSPRLLPARRRNLRSLHALTLLQHQAAPAGWRTCADALGIEIAAPTSGPRFEQYSALISAACADMGVGLVPLCLVTDELNSQRLIRLTENRLDIGHGHFLCYRRERIGNAVVRQFRDWLMSEAGGAASQ